MPERLLHKLFCVKKKCKRTYCESHIVGVQEAPYILENVANRFSEEEPSVRLAVLSAAAKLFFRRAPECQKLLGLVLSQVCKVPTRQELVNRPSLARHWI